MRFFVKVLIIEPLIELFEGLRMSSDESLHSNSTMATCKSPFSNTEKFKGDGGLSVDYWVNMVDDAFTLGVWTPAQQLVLASQQLSGAAAIWYQSIRGSALPFIAWKELKAGLMERFGGHRSSDIARLELTRMRWTEKQDLETHITSFTATRSRIPDAGHLELVTYFRQTLPADYLTDSLRAQPKNLQEAITAARTLYHSRRHGVFVAAPSPPSTTHRYRANGLGHVSSSP